MLSTRTLNWTCCIPGACAQLSMTSTIYKYWSPGESLKTKTWNDLENKDGKSCWDLRATFSSLSMDVLLIQQRVIKNFFFSFPICFAIKNYENTWKFENLHLFKKKMYLGYTWRLKTSGHISWRRLNFHPSHSSDQLSHHAQTASMF